MSSQLKSASTYSEFRSSWNAKFLNSRPPNQPTNQHFLCFSLFFSVSWLFATLFYVFAALFDDFPCLGWFFVFQGFQYYQQLKRRKCNRAVAPRRRRAAEFESEMYVVLRLSPSGDFEIPIDAYSPCFRQTGKPRPGDIGPSVHWHYVALSKGCA